MTSQTGQQIIAIHTLPEISRAKGNQALKFGQSRKYSVRNIFIQKVCRNELGRLVQDLLLFFKKALHKARSALVLIGQHVNFNTFWQTSIWIYKKSKLYDTNQIRRKLRILSHLLKKSLMKNFIFSAVHKTRKIKIKSAKTKQIQM